MLLAALVLATAPVAAQTGPTPGAAAPAANVSAVGRKMPPANAGSPARTAVEPGAPGTAGEPRTKATAESEMLKSQKAAEERNKAWDGRMRKTMGSICSGC